MCRHGYGARALNDRGDYCYDVVKLPGSKFLYGQVAEHLDVEQYRRDLKDLGGILDDVLLKDGRNDSRSPGSPCTDPG